MIKNWLIWGLVLLCIGCTTPLEVRPGPIESLLEIKGTISPQSGLEVIVQHTRSPYEWIPMPLDSAFVVDDAEISIYHQDTLVDVCIYQGNSFYQSRLPHSIIPGEVYSVKVKAAKYPPAAIENILVPESPPEVRALRLAPFPNRSDNLSLVKDSLFFDVKNYRGFTVYRIDVRYDSLPLNSYISYIGNLEETFDPCEGTYYFTNRCFSDSWISRIYEYSYDRSEDRKTYFHISVIDPKVLDFIQSGYFSGEDVFVEPPLYQGNVDGGFGYIVGENKIIVPII